MIKLGVARLLEGNCGSLRNKHVGLLTNNSAVDRSGNTTAELLAASDCVHLVKLFAPEHGFEMQHEAGEVVPCGVWGSERLPVVSLYGEQKADLAWELQELDAVVCDLPDVGARYYTHLSSVLKLMKATGAGGIPLVILDRPNPLGGEIVQGNVIEPTFFSSVGAAALPMRHGMTFAELVKYAAAQREIGCEVEIVPLTGWNRMMWHDATGLPWRNPSPNIRSLESALLYCGTCLFEGTNLSEGRGTEKPFCLIGAPWLNAKELAASLQGVRGMGIEARPTEFLPTSSKYAGERCFGLELVLSEREGADPTMAAIAVLVATRALHRDELRFDEAHFDRLAGTDKVRLGLLDGLDVEGICATWVNEREEFLKTRQNHILYD